MHLPPSVPIVPRAVAERIDSRRSEFRAVLPRLALGFGGNPAAVELVVRPYGIVAAAILRREKIVAREESAAPQLENHARGDAVLYFARQRVERRRSRKRRGLRGFAIGGRLAGFALLYHA